MSLHHVATALPVLLCTISHSLPPLWAIHFVRPGLACRRSRKARTAMLPMQMTNENRLYPILQVLVQIVLLNLLIAKLSDAYAKIKASSLLASNFQQVS